MVSSGLPTSMGLRGLRRVIRARSTTTTVTRATVTLNELDEETETTDDHTESLWLYEPQERVAEEATGERANGDLAALAIADDAIDIQHNDRITHGGVEYTVDTVIGHPEDADADGTATPDAELFIISLQRRHT